MTMTDNRAYQVLMEVTSQMTGESRPLLRVKAQISRLLQVPTINVRHGLLVNFLTAKSTNGQFMGKWERDYWPL